MSVCEREERQRGCSLFPGDASLNLSQLNTDAKRSALGAALAAAVALPWAAAFTLGGPRLVGQALFDKLNVATWDLDSYGLRF